MAYQWHEIEAYFGDYFSEYVEQAISYIDMFGMNHVAEYMDKDIRENLTPTPWHWSELHFLLAYMMAHTEKYGEDFIIN